MLSKSHYIGRKVGKAHRDLGFGSSALTRDQSELPVRVAEEQRKAASSVSVCAALVFLLFDACQNRIQLPNARWPNCKREWIEREPTIRVSSLGERPRPTLSKHSARIGNLEMNPFYSRFAINLDPRFGTLIRSANDSPRMLNPPIALRGFVRQRLATWGKS